MNRLRLPLAVVALVWLAANAVVHFASFAGISPLPRELLVPIVGFLSVVMVILTILATRKEQSSYPQFRQRASRAGCVFVILILYIVAVGAYSLSVEARPWAPYVFARVITAFAIGITWWPIAVFSAQVWSKDSQPTESK